MAQKYGSYRNLIILVVVLIALVIGILSLVSGIGGDDNNISTETSIIEKEKNDSIVDSTKVSKEKVISDTTIETDELTHDENITEEIEPVIVDEDKNKTIAEDTPPIKSIIETVEAFSFIPKKPLSNGRLKASVELGAEGFNYFIIKIDKNKNWELKESKYGYSLVYEGKSDVDSLTNGLKKYIAETANYGVDPKDIHFLISSGALLKPETQNIIKAVKKNHYVPNEITSKNEGKYGFWATVPKEYRDSSFFVDIGSGNTKIAWLEGKKLKTISTYGAKYYLDDDKDNDVYDSVKNSIIDKIPESNRKRCFIIGGVPYKLAKTIRKDKENYTTLYSPKTYLSDTDKYKTNGKKLQSGLNIYQAIKDATQTKQFIFYWNTNFTIGYLLRLSY
jgi:hypothetical protein